ncbi:aspartyl-tRNA amidotransferase subunit B [Vulcanimicrobium alpinum]|uniref:Aspartyl-tRNA amidotransferase subunit B n=1 Tax=Vulcanimicrobium alpinum TaxID=3016050 RepID=A0AAN1XXD8_UNVUL|nr:GatB/YqeY domain-containing protein [Vulcanimicrobium alpinum]BDE06351.1 aspartyl-tRNA amidotransferase subunit B [Vulcanimicrobium alpinum]
MSIKDEITADMKEAMKARDQLRLDTLRSIVSAFNYRRIEAGADLSEADQLAVVQKLVKQRTDSIDQYAKAGRTELVEKETREREILVKYLPAQKSADEIRGIVRAALAGLPADGRNQGAVMKLVMPQLKGVADGNVVRQVVGEELGSA